MRAHLRAGRGAGSLIVLLAVSPLVSAEFFVDCDRGEDAADGRTPGSAWRTLDRVNSAGFLPGDRILLHRGTRCEGMLRPLGSGAPDRPILLGAYGSGPLPIIDAGDNQAAIRLFNQDHWHLQEVETIGGNPFGILISGDSGPLYHFRIKDVVVHDVRGSAMNKESGLVVVTPGSAETTFHDVVIDGVTAHTSTQWAGILVGGDDFGGTPASPRSTDVTIRNCTVHDVHGDGIVLYQVDRGLIETSVAYRTGRIPTADVGTPNGIWTWMCDDCTVQYNEGYLTDSPGVDGGVFDIDYGCSNTVVQYNYAHDAAAYCVSIFGAYSTTRNSVIRYNVCAGNARDASKAYQGEIYLLTWGGGRIDGVQIHNNTIHWSPAADGFALNAAGARFSGDLPRRFENNIVYSTTPRLVDLRGDSGFELDHNIYWYGGPGAPLWRVGALTASRLADWRALGFDDASLHTDPLLVDPSHHDAGLPTRAFMPRRDSPAIDAGTTPQQAATRDLLGTPVPFGAAPDIGALEWHPLLRIEPGPIPWRHRAQSRGQRHGGPMLLAFVGTDETGALDASRKQVVFLRSMARQHAAAGLSVLLLADPAQDWDLRDVTVLEDEGGRGSQAFDVRRFPTTFLIDDRGFVRARWEGFTPAYRLDFAVRAVVSATRPTAYSSVPASPRNP